MTKRKRFLETLKDILDYSLNSDAVLNTILVIFVIAFGIVGFIISKKVPIPLTEKEIEYYTSQAEVGYLKGVFYLDDGVEFIPANDTTFNVYSSEQPDEKQKLKVTFSGNIVSNAEAYYSVYFIRDRVSLTLLYSLLGVPVWLLFIFLMQYISSRIQPSEKCDCPLNF